MPIIQNLIADAFGSHVGKYSGRLKVTKGKEVLAQAPLIHLETLTISNRGVSISADAIRACTDRGIPIHFVGGSGTPFAALYSSGLIGTVVTRRTQLEAYHDARSLYLSAGLIEGKLENQAAFLRYAAKYRKEVQAEVFDTLRQLDIDIQEHLGEIDTWLQVNLHDNLAIRDCRFELMSIEGRAAKQYWAGIGLLVPDYLDWPGRRTRGATDVLNSALNYGYGILYGEVQRALVLAGLDPFAGFVHADRPGKESLVLDLMEVFRAPVVDRPVIGLLNRGTQLEQDDRGYFVDKSRRTLAEKVIDRLDTAERYSGKRFTLRTIIQQQARAIAMYLRHEREEFRPYIAKW